MRFFLQIMSNNEVIYDFSYTKLPRSHAVVMRLMTPNNGVIHKTRDVQSP